MDRYAEVSQGPQEPLLRSTMYSPYVLSPSSSNVFFLALTLCHQMLYIVWYVGSQLLSCQKEKSRRHFLHLCLRMLHVIELDISSHFFEVVAMLSQTSSNIFLLVDI